MRCGSAVDRKSTVSLTPLALAATAEENAAIGKITLLNREAIEEYRKLNFDEAQRLLDQALDLAAGAGLTQHPIRARTYVTLGVVSAGGLKRRDVAVRLFRKALQIQPEITLSPELATPDVQVAFDEAVRGLENEPKIERLPSELLVHEPVTAGTRGDPITIAVTPDEALHAERVMLAYRAAGASAFSKIKMQKQSKIGVFEAIIPAPATSASDVAYYIEARDLDDKLVASRGSPIAPMVITPLAGAAKGRFARGFDTGRPVAGEGDVASAPAPGTPAKPRRQPRCRAPSPRSPPRREPRFLIALLIGGGSGWSSGTSEFQWLLKLGNAKLGWSTLGQVVPQIGYLVSSRFMLSAWGRFQLVHGASDYHTPPGSAECGGDGICSAARGAFAGFASATFFTWGNDVPRPYPIAFDRRRPRPPGRPRRQRQRRLWRRSAAGHVRRHRGAGSVPRRAGHRCPGAHGARPAIGSSPCNRSSARPHRRRHRCRTPVCAVLF